jgi:hypothetical protein
MQRNITGSEILIFINSRPYGLAKNIQIQENVGYRGIKTIDNLDDWEHAPTSTKVSGSIGFHRLSGQDFHKKIGITTSFEDISRLKYYKIALISKKSDRVLIIINRCVTTMQSYNTDANSLFMGSISFEGIYTNS